MNFLHCFYGVGSMISPNIMALALKYKSWKEGYRWTAYIQMGILVICFLTLPLWKNEKENKKENNNEVIKEENKDIDNDNKINKINVISKVERDNINPIENNDNKINKINVISKVERDNINPIETKEEFKNKETEVNMQNKNKEDKKDNEEEEEKVKAISILEAIKIRGAVFSCLAFFCYCSGEGTCFLWTSSFFEGTKDGLSKESIASLSTTIFGGLMLGRVISGIVSEKLGDKKLIRIGLLIECIGIICVGIPIKSYILAAIGYCLTSIGMGPIFPSIQHLTPSYFGKDASATVIGLNMASAAAGMTFMPFIFGLIQSKTSMWANPIFVGTFAILNFIFIEIEFKLCDKNIKNKSENEGDKKENIENNI